MLNHSFVLDALEHTAEDTFHHFEELIDEHRSRSSPDDPPSRLKQLVPTVNTFHTRLPLRKAFIAYNKKYALTKRKHITISFNELRHILNLAQIMALRNIASAGAGTGADEEHNNDDEDEEFQTSLEKWEKSPGLFSGIGTMIPAYNPPPEMSLGAPALAPLASVEGTNASSVDGSVSVATFATNFTSTTTGVSTATTAVAPTSTSSTNKSTDSTKTTSNNLPFKGPRMITFDGDQTLYSDGANFDRNPELALYLYLLLRHGVTIAVVTAAGYEYDTEKYELRLSGLLTYFKERKLPVEDCERFYLFGGECNYLLVLGKDYKLHPVREYGPGGWHTATKYIEESPGNWDEKEVQLLLDVAEHTVRESVKNLRIRGRVIRKKRSVGLVPTSKHGCACIVGIPREALDETVLTAQEKLDEHTEVKLPFCAFNGGNDAWVDVGNKRVGVNILAAYVGMPVEQTLHIGDQFLNTGNDFAARDVCPCIWITCPDETTYILKTILRLAGVSLQQGDLDDDAEGVSTCTSDDGKSDKEGNKEITVNLKTVASRNAMMDVYTGEMLSQS